MVVGTTGWYEELSTVRTQVEKNNTGFVYGPNFSIGVNLFFELVRASAPAIQHRLRRHVFATPAHKKILPWARRRPCSKFYKQATGRKSRSRLFAKGMS